MLDIQTKWVIQFTELCNNDNMTTLRSKAVYGVNLLYYSM